jgi:hypothetical protein
MEGGGIYEVVAYVVACLPARDCVAGVGNRSDQREDHKNLSRVRGEFNNSTISAPH